MLLIELNAIADQSILDETAKLHHQAVLQDRTYPSNNYFSIAQKPGNIMRLLYRYN